MASCGEKKKTLLRSKPASSRTAALVVVIISDVPGNSRERPRKGGPGSSECGKLPELSDSCRYGVSFICNNCVFAAWAVE